MEIENLYRNPPGGYLNPFPIVCEDRERLCGHPVKKESSQNQSLIEMGYV